MESIKLSIKDNWILFSVCLVIFIDSVGIGLIFPILPTLFTVNEYGLLLREPAIHSNYLYGITVALYPAASLLGMPILGKLSDLFGRKKLLIYGVTGLFFSYMLSIVAILTHNISMFLISRFIAGFNTGTQSICGAAIVELDSQKYDKVLGLKFMTLANILGFIMGPTIAYFMPDTHTAESLTIPFFIAGGFCLLNLVLLQTFYPAEALREKYKKNATFKDLKEALQFVFKPKIRYLMFGYLLFNLGFDLFLQSQSLYLTKVYLYSAQQISFFFIIMGLIFAISMFVVHPKINKILNVKTQIKMGVFIMGLGLLIYTWFNSNMLYDISSKIKFTWLNAIVFYLATPFVTLNMTKIFSDIAPSDAQGNLMGSLGQISSISSILGALTMAVLFTINQHLNAVCGGALILAGAFILRTSLKNNLPHEI